MGVVQIHNPINRFTFSDRKIMLFAPACLMDTKTSQTTSDVSLINYDCYLVNLAGFFFSVLLRFQPWILLGWALRTFDFEGAKQWRSKRVCEVCCCILIYKKLWFALVYTSKFHIEFALHKFSQLFSPSRMSNWLQFQELKFHLMGQRSGGENYQVYFSVYAML